MYHSITTLQPPSDWYKKIWGMGIKDMSWVEQTTSQVDFIEEALELRGNERILDLACGFGRHSLELAKRGYEVVGVDITEAYIEDANRTAKEMGADASFYCCDIRGLLEAEADLECSEVLINSMFERFDVVLNLADGAIGYLESDEENLKIFDVIAQTLKPGGKSLIDICSKAHALKYFPKKTWEIGKKEISLPWFDFDKQTNRMLYGGFGVAIGEIATVPESMMAHSSTRLYDYKEITDIFKVRGIETAKGFGEYSIETPYSDDYLQLIIVSVKG